MTPARRRALAAGLLILIAATMIAAVLMRRERVVPPGKRPTLLLLTSLPLVFGEDFSVEQNGSPALNALQMRYNVLPISTTTDAELAKGKLLLMAQPLGQAPEDLVALDQWVRRGGRVQLLADPLLEWPSKLPLGNPLRPPPTFVDTGLLAHWGLRLNGPVERGPTLRQLGGFEIVTVSPGTLAGTCHVGADRLAARCNVGKGVAQVVADADFLDVDDLRGPTQHNIEALLAELAKVARP